MWNLKVVIVSLWSADGKTPNQHIVQLVARVTRPIQSAACKVRRTTS